MKKETGELLEILKRSPDLSAYMKIASDDITTPVSVSVYLRRLMEEKGLEKKQVIHASGLERKYGYEILGDSCRKKPSRDKVLALCFAMQLTGDEVQELLKRTDYLQLYPKYERDSIIFFGFSHGLSLEEVNDLLYEMHYPVIDSDSRDSEKAE